MTYYDNGDTIRVTQSYLSTASTVLEPTTVRLLKQTPDGAVSTPSVTHPSSDVYYVDIVTTASGTYLYRWESTGTAVQASESWFFVRPERVTT